MTRWAVRGISDLVDRRPALLPLALDALRRVRAEARFIPQKLAGDPRDALDEGIGRLEGLARPRP